ncbi:hypothetical protein F442_19928 [Phytophthora nicotianae P10297]|uniref:Uncharacterized protein n=1 Tax=Phytophthora nicotianae P10297 TaxID=1317064 RepID=W2Y975_PHYNI|nr:hypothetical protein F442_19928 [Phytophthora nicotianae P10297]
MARKLILRGCRYLPSGSAWWRCTNTSWSAGVVSSCERDGHVPMWHTTAPPSPRPVRRDSKRNSWRERDWSHRSLPIRVCAGSCCEITGRGALQCCCGVRFASDKLARRMVHVRVYGVNCLDAHTNTTKLKQSDGRSATDHVKNCSASQ